MRHRGRIVLLTVALTLCCFVAFYRPSWSPVLVLPSPDAVNGVIYHSFYPLDRNHDHTIRAHAQLSDACLEHWVADGRWEGPCKNQVVDEAVIDLVYTWVNGSDPLHEQARASYNEVPSTNAARFRDHNELRYSLRAAAKATETWKNSAWHIITADFAHPRDPESRLGQIPQWLDMDRPSRRGEPKIHLHHHSQLFQPVNSTADAAISWKANMLPTFNSYAIESQLPNLDPNIVSDSIVALNDDQFLMLPTPPSAFHSPLYGPVFRLEAHNQVTGDASGKADGNGEWRSLTWSAHLLNQRFGNRTRAYVSHNARALSLPLMHETMLAFPKEFSSTPLSRFRGSHDECEVNTVFLCTHWVIERKREVLLWSWIVAKWGREGMLDQAAMWREMGGTDGDDDITLDFEKTRTMPDEMDRQFSLAGLRSPRVPDRNVAAFTHYLFVSKRWISDRDKRAEAPGTLSRKHCFENIAAWDLFISVMKHKPECGDAIITLLIHQERLAGGSGLSVFLPPPSASDPITVTLPLHLPSHAPPHPRLLALKLLYRYSYAIGDTPARFLGLISYRQASLGLRHVTEDRDIALLCVNDDLERVGEEEVRRVDGLLRGWFEGRWA
ncbi:hypothetical protein BDZ89DRAFT_1160874 [Hymenopellis radicata]|nr:hypothetical protein BDZ89DRAFT_1160874 [Hymenopellis radicata]